MACNLTGIFEYSGEDENLKSRFKGYFILVHVEFYKVALISLGARNRVVDPVEVVDSDNITDEEFNRICGGEAFKKVDREVLIR